MLLIDDSKYILILNRQCGNTHCLCLFSVSGLTESVTCGSECDKQCSIDATELCGGSTTSLSPYWFTVFCKNLFISLKVALKENFNYFILFLNLRTP